MKRYTTRFACLATAHRKRATSQVKITQLDIADLLHTEPCIDEQCQKRFITRTENSVLLTVSSSRASHQRLQREGIAETPILLEHP